MKLFSPILLLLASFSALPIFAAPNFEPPKKTILDWATEEISMRLGRQERILLARHMPFLFGQKFACEFKSGSQKRSILSGDWIETPAEGGQLTCPNGYMIKAQAGTKFLILTGKDRMSARVDQGTLVAQWGESPIILETLQMTFRALGQSPKQVVTIKADADTTAITCEVGVINADYRFHGDEINKQVLASTACQMALSINDSSLIRYLHAGDRVLVPNAMLPRKHWPLEQIPQGEVIAQNYQIEGQIALTPLRATEKNKPAQLRWEIRSGSDMKLRCLLFGRENNVDQMKQIKEFEINKAKGEIPQENGWENIYLSMVCRTTNQTLVSNVLVPAK